MFISMRWEEDTHLGIYELDFMALNADPDSDPPPAFRKITSDDGVHYLYPTYVWFDLIHSIVG